MPWARLGSKVGRTLVARIRQPIRHLRGAPPRRSTFSDFPTSGQLEGHPYLPFLHMLEKPGRYVGGELYSRPKSAADVSIALAFPDAYEIGMSPPRLSHSLFAFE